MSTNGVLVLDALDTAVDAAKAAADHKGCVKPAAVISIIDDICIDTCSGKIDNLPKEFRALREEAHRRKQQGDTGYRIPDLCERLTMFGAWVVAG